MIKSISLISFVLLFVSCGATFSKKDCGSADWRQIGYNDAVEGEPVSHYDHYSSICSSAGITPNGNIYQEGYMDGIDAFCTEENGYKRGKQAGRFHSSCPKNSGYIVGYNEGMKKFKEKEEKRRIERLTRPKGDVTDSRGVPSGMPGE